ncbi:MAG: right-handed parallel beta-helix repeat-containing protein [Opitutales bacterium]
MRSIRPSRGPRPGLLSRCLLAAVLAGWSTLPAGAQTRRSVTPGDGESALAAVLPEVRARLAGGERVELVLAPGDYRSALDLRFDEPVDGRLTLRSAGQGTARLTRARPLGPGWEPVNFRTWRFLLPPEAVLDPEPVLFYGDVRLEMNPNRAALDVWQVFLDRDRRELVLAVPEDAELDPARMDVVYPEPDSLPLITLSGLAAVTLKGLTVERFSGREAAVRVENCDRVALRRLSVTDTGGTGLSLVACGKVSGLDLVVDRNGNGGLRIQQADTVALGRSYFRFNGSYGLTLASVAGARLYRITVSDQPADGLILRGDGAHTVQDSVFGHNGGVHVRTAGPVATIDSTRIAFGGGTGLLVEAGSVRCVDSIIYDAGAFAVRAREAAGLSLRDSIVVAGETEPFGVVAIGEETTYRGSGNLFFGLGEFIAFRHAKRDTAFAAWQEAVESDLDSLVGDPAFADPEAFEFLPGFQSPWFRKNDWPVRQLPGGAGNDR